MWNSEDEEHWQDAKARLGKAYPGGVYCVDCGELMNTGEWLTGRLFDSELLEYEFTPQCLACGIAEDDRRRHATV